MIANPHATLCFQDTDSQRSLRFSTGHEVSSPRPRQLGGRSGPIGSFSMRAAVYCPAGNQPDKISAHGAWLHLFLLAPNAFCGIRVILCSYQGLRLASWLDGGRWGARRHVRWLADSALVVCFFGICGQP